MSHLWIIIGLCGQGAFSARFLIQWIASERAHKSIIPVQFWVASIFGSVILLAYAIHKKDPVFILGQSAGLVVYMRNLALINGERRAQSA